MLARQSTGDGYDKVTQDFAYAVQYEMVCPYY